MHPNRVIIDENGKLTHAEFDIVNFWAGAYDYVRISIVDENGKKHGLIPYSFNLR